MFMLPGLHREGATEQEDVGRSHREKRVGATNPCGSCACTTCKQGSTAYATVPCSHLAFNQSGDMQIGPAKLWQQPGSAEWRQVAVAAHQARKVTSIY